MADRPSETMGAGIEVAAGSLSLIVSDQPIAAWPLDRVDIEVETDGFHFIVDGEEFIFVTREASELAEAVGLFERERQQNSGRTKTLKRPEAKAVREKPVKQTAGKRAKAKPTSKASRPSKPARVRPVRPSRELPHIDLKSPTTQLGIASLVLCALLGVFARPLLAFALMGAGSLGLLLGTGALIDPIVATRLPSDLTAGKAILISVVLLLTGMLVLVV